MNKYWAAVLCCFFPITALSRGTSGFGDIFLVIGLIGIAFVVTMILFGEPPALINKAFNRDASHELGGKIFALSFLAGPVCSYPLHLLLDGDNAAIALLGGYVLSIFLLNHYFTRNK